METPCVIGTWQATIEHTPHYFAERYCVVDCRGEVSIDRTTVFGYGVKILSMSHDIGDGTCGPAVVRRVRIDGNSWIARYCMLAACWIQEHAFLAGGSVVTGVVVPSYTLVQGNPAMIVARFDLTERKWKRLACPEPCAPWAGRRK